MITAVKDDHETVFQDFTVLEQGLQLTGVISTWHCDKTDRIYLFYYIPIAQVTNQQDLLTEFQQYLDSLQCH